jgi:hypothetical protein
MRVMYRSAQASRSSPAVYRQGPVKFCCAAMCRAWGVLIGFGVKDYPASTSREVNLYAERWQAGGKPVLELIPVGYCPFCGEPVETCRVK